MLVIIRLLILALGLISSYSESMALDVAVDGVKPSQAMKSAARQTITDTVSRTISAQLGKLYHGGALPDGAHEVLHGASAYTIEKFRSGSSKKARSAAAGAISAEVFTKLYVSNAAVFSNPDATPKDLQAAIDRGLDLSRLTAASVATLMKLNAEVTANAAFIAAQENGFALVRMFINMATRWGSRFMKGGAKSVSNALRLRTELAFREAGILDKAGKLTKKAIEGSEAVNLKGNIIRNTKIIKELTRDGSKIIDWKKYTTKSIKMPNGQSKQIHFYKNVKTKKIDYRTMDYKVKDIINQ